MPTLASCHIRCSAWFSIGRLMLKSIWAVVGNLSGVPDNLTVCARKLKSVARRVRNKILMEREPPTASRATDDVENVDTLSHCEDDEAHKEPRRAGQNRAGNRRDKRGCPSPIWEEHSARQWACLCHTRRRCLTNQLSGGIATADRAHPAPRKVSNHRSGHGKVVRSSALVRHLNSHASSGPASSSLARRGKHQQPCRPCVRTSPSAAP